MSRSFQEPSQRQLRVGEQLRHIIAETLLRGHFHDPVLLDAGKITVTEVKVAPDLKNATVFVLSLGGEDMEHILPALNDAANYFQGEINRKTELKFTPKLKFKIDDSFEKAQRLDSILNNLTYSKETEKNN
jgi:ribosome-binding factor A